MEIMLLYAGVTALIAVYLVAAWAIRATRPVWVFLGRVAVKSGPVIAWLAWYGLLWGVGIYSIFTLFNVLGPIVSAILFVLFLYSLEQNRR